MREKGVQWIVPQDTLAINVLGKNLGRALAPLCTGFVSSRIPEKRDSACGKNSELTSRGIKRGSP